jgi:hypothetical protein
MTYDFRLSPANHPKSGITPEADCTNCTKVFIFRPDQGERRTPARAGRIDRRTPSPDGQHTHQAHPERAPDLAQGVPNTPQNRRKKINENILKFALDSTNASMVYLRASEETGQKAQQKRTNDNSRETGRKKDKK